MEMMKSILTIAVASLIAGSVSAAEFPHRDGDFNPSKDVFRDVVRQMTAKGEKTILLSAPRGHVSQVEGGGVMVPLMFKVSKHGHVSYQSATFFVRKAKTGFFIMQFGPGRTSHRKALSSYLALTKKKSKKECGIWTEEISAIDMDNHAFTAKSTPCDKVVW